VIDLTTIKDHRPHKGPGRLAKSEKDEATRRHVWALRWQKRQQYRAPVRKSYISVKWAADGSAEVVWMPKYAKGMTGLWYRLEDFKWWGYHRRSALNAGIEARFKAATRLASDKAGV
jgi:hypothetical protein